MTSAKETASTQGLARRVWTLLRYEALSATKYSFNQLLSSVSPVLASHYIYRQRLGRPLNLRTPRDFNEKIMWLKLHVYANNVLATQCGDKYRVRDYVRPHLGEQVLNPLLHVWDRVEDIAWPDLPRRFAIKCNHGCKYNLICADKSALDIPGAKKTLKRWYREDWWRRYAEIQYRHIQKKIICEAYIDTGRYLPCDYKIYCFYGTPRVALVCMDRETSLALEWYDLSWNPLDLGRMPNRQKATRPDSFERMLEYSRALSKPFPFARIDFYDVRGRPLFGEITLVPAAGMADYYNEKGNQYLGDMLALPSARKPLSAAYPGS